MAMKSILFISLFLLCGLFFSKAQIRLVFSYDESGNQISRLLLLNTVKPISNIPVPHISSVEKEKTEEELFWENIQIYPIPIKSTLTLSWNTEMRDLISNINIYEHSTFSNLFAIKTNNFNNKIDINMTGYRMGVYILSFTLKNGKTYTKNIIKE